MEMIGDIAAKNESGTFAADFEYIDLNGHKSTLKQTASQYRQLILIFYDPDCNSCHDIIKKIADSPPLNQAITTKDLGVLAVYTGNDFSAWQNDTATMPSNWIVAIDFASKIEDEGKYNLPSMPVIYILDSKSRVIIKNADISTIL